MSENLDDCARLRERVEEISGALAYWADRDTAKAQPEVRQAVNTAVESIDAALSTLHRIRRRLDHEMRQFDDAAVRRSGELREREAGQ